MAFYFLIISVRRFAIGLAAATVLALPFTSVSAKTSEPWTGVVTFVVDGDTLHIRPLAGGKPFKVRLSGIDAPEICQSGGLASRDALSRRVMGRAVRVDVKTRDAYSRLVASVALDGQDVAQWMVLQGQAWSYGYRRSAGPYGAQQAQAQAARRGVFSVGTGLRTPLRPDEFRKQRKSCYR
jgi:micrococcal nuclease